MWSWRVSVGGHLVSRMPKLWKAREGFQVVRPVAVRYSRPPAKETTTSTTKLPNITALKNYIIPARHCHLANIHAVALTCLQIHYGTSTPCFHLGAPAPTKHQCATSSQKRPHQHNQTVDSLLDNILSWSQCSYRLDPTQKTAKKIGKWLCSLTNHIGT